jgi:sec-independent protein translocase protein TatA
MIRGIVEILLVILVILLIFGSTKLPHIGRTLGQLARDFREASKEGNSKDIPISGTPSLPEASISKITPDSPAQEDWTVPAAPDKTPEMHQSISPRPNKPEALIENLVVGPESTVTIQFTVTPPPQKIKTISPSQKAQKTEFISGLKNLFRRVFRLR